jgi:hypothetical protein
MFVLSDTKPVRGFLKSTVSFKPSIYCLKKIPTPCLYKQLITRYKAQYMYFTSGITYAQNKRLREYSLAKQITSNDPTGSNFKSVTFGTLERP